MLWRVGGNDGAALLCVGQVLCGVQPDTVCPLAARSLLLVVKDGALLAWSSAQAAAAAPARADEAEELGVRAAKALARHAVRSVARGGDDDAGAGSHWWLAVLRDGALWSWGSAAAAAAPGLGRAAESVTAALEARPVRLPSGVRVEMVSCGARHALALDSTGLVHAWGRGEQGRLGLGDERDRAEPARVAALERAGARAVLVSAGHHHSLALTADCRVWSWGSGACGKLGHGSQLAEFSPREVKHLRVGGARVAVGSHAPVCWAAAGAQHSALLTSAGQVLTCGRNDRGQLGHADAQGALEPTLVESLAQQGVVLRKVVCADDYTLALTAAGAVLALGSCPGLPPREALDHRPRQVTLPGLHLAAEALSAHCVLLGPAGGASVGASAGAPSVCASAGASAEASAGASPTSAGTGSTLAGLASPSQLPPVPPVGNFWRPRGGRQEDSTPPQPPQQHYHHHQQHAAQKRAPFPEPLALRLGAEPRCAHHAAYADSPLSAHLAGQGLEAHRSRRPQLLHCAQCSRETVLQLSRQLRARDASIKELHARLEAERADAAAYRELCLRQDNTRTAARLIVSKLRGAELQSSAMHSFSQLVLETVEGLQARVLQLENTNAGLDAERAELSRRYDRACLLLEQQARAHKRRSAELAAQALLTPEKRDAGASASAAAVVAAAQAQVQAQAAAAAAAAQAAQAASPSAASDSPAPAMSRLEPPFELGMIAPSWLLAELREDKQHQLLLWPPRPAEDDQGGRAPGPLLVSSDPSSGAARSPACSPGSLEAFLA